MTQRSARSLPFWERGARRGVRLKQGPHGGRIHAKQNVHRVVVTLVQVVEKGIGGSLAAWEHRVLGGRLDGGWNLLVLVMVRNGRVDPPREGRVNLVQQHLRMVVVVQDDNGPVWDGGGIGRRVEPLVVPKEVVVKPDTFGAVLRPTNNSLQGPMGFLRGKKERGFPMRRESNMANLNMTVVFLFVGMDVQESH